ncbi:DNA/RNA non-specific endonuclease [Mycetocola zhujimingii]|uniref:DNA/RNA non-specific endonuclease n=1 Tax=Mycetocola zhujimingii TaxID=2079792 RepID=A0A2U1TA84_9MICO|nr:DNA/RNA non-specific endonuclease [Mycetocola zhujimingii]PWC04591.1 hypothetical protein DF223_14155 [Mycetocola zhujimingii]
MSKVVSSTENGGRAFGYDPDFLAAGVPLPLPGAGRNVTALDYRHFSVLLDTDRRLAAATAVNIDGANLVDLERGDDWHLDPRIPADQQAGPELYRSNDLDRGHLVRRRDPVWGAPDIAAQANRDTFSYANAAPQASEFNQSKLLWLGLEDYLLEHASAYHVRLSVFTGCVFSDADPEYRGIRIPLAFWKVAAWTKGDAELASTGYVVDQRPQLDDVDLTERFRLGSPDQAVPPLGPFRTFQVPIVDIERVTSLSFGDVTGADRYIAAGLSPEKPRWVKLEEFSEMAL